MRFEGRLGIQQRVLPGYRVPFFEQLAECCEGGLSILAGQPMARESIEDGAAALRIASLRRTSNIYVGGTRHYVVYQPAAVRWLKEWNPDVLILEASLRTASNVALWAAAHALDRPVVGWGLGILPWTSVPRLDLVRRRLMYSVFKRFDATIAYTSKAKSDYESLGIPSERIRVAPNSTAELRVAFPRGLRTDWLGEDDAFRREMGIGDKPMIVSLGRLVPWKNIDLLLRAFHGLEQEAELVIVGEGGERSRLEALADDLGVRVIFLGDRRNDDLDRVMAAADVFVMPGLGGLALQEALCWGLPVVVAGGDGSEKDLVHDGENGFLVPAGDASTLRDAVRRLVRSAGLRQSMGAASLKIVRSGFGSMAMLREFVSVLNTVRPRSTSRLGEAQGI